MTINGIPISQFGAKLRADYTVSGASVETSYQKSRRGSTYLFLGSKLGLKTLTLPFDLYGATPAAAQRQLSELDALAASGKVEIGLPNGFLYTSFLQVIATPLHITDRILSCSYSFAGIQHLGKIQREAKNGVFFAEGTLPEMDCVLSVTVGAAAGKYAFCGVNFSNVQKGDRLVLDGVTKRVLVNGAPGAARCDLVEFPQLVPGFNLLECKDTVTVEYYPSYL